MEKNESLKMPTRGEDFLGFFNIHFVAKLEKNLSEMGALCWKKIEKSRTMPHKFERGDPLVSPGNVCYAEWKLFLV